MGFPFPGPIPSYQNVAPAPQYYLPNRFVISNILLGQTTTVTTTANMNYVIGQLVRLNIPQEYGCFQLNGQSGYVIGIPAANQVILNIYSQFFDPFFQANLTNVPQIVPVG